MFTEDRRDSFKKFVLKQPEKTRETVKKIHNNMFAKTSPRGCEVLYELAAGLHDDVAGYVFEFGTFRGGSTNVMADAVRTYKKSKSVISIDSGKSKGSNVIMAQELTSKHELSDYVCYVIFDDLSYFERINRLTPRLIYVDSTHHYNHVKRTLEICPAYLPVGGWLALDDYVDKEWSGVIPAVNQFLDTTTLTFTPYRVGQTNLVCLQREG